MKQRKPAEILFEKVIEPEVRELARKARTNLRHKQRADWWAKHGEKKDE